MITTQLEAQGMTCADLRVQTAEVLSTLSEDQLLVVLAYARALMAERHLPAHHLLEDLLEDTH